MFRGFSLKAIQSSTAICEPPITNFKGNVMHKLKPNLEIHHQYCKRNRLFGKPKPLHPAVKKYLARKKFLRIKLFHFEILLRLA